MSRHRDVRNMDFSDDYDGYEDVYGHSVDDDYYISPSNEQFLFNRENSREQPKIGEFTSSESDIKEEDESDVAMELSDDDKELLESCMKQVKETLGKTSLTKTELRNLAMSHNFNVERVMNAILNEQEQPFFSPPANVEKGVATGSTPVNKFIIPNISNLKLGDTAQPFSIKNNFTVPKFGSLATSPKPSPKATFTVPKLNSGAASPKFSNLSELMSNHLNKSVRINLASEIIKDSSEVDSLKMNSLNLSSSNSAYKIDLSSALKSVSNTSVSSSSKIQRDFGSGESAEFEIPFVDCDADFNMQRNNVYKPCKLDSSAVLEVCLKCAKSASDFGRVMCTKPKRDCKRPWNDDEIICQKLRKFTFNTSSPDDNVAKHIKSL